MSENKLLSNLQQYFAEAKPEGTPLGLRLKAQGVSTRGLGPQGDIRQYQTYKELFLDPKKPKAPAGIIKPDMTPGYTPGGFEAQPSPPTLPVRSDFPSLAEFNKAMASYLKYKDTYPKLLATWTEKHKTQQATVQAATRNQHLAIHSQRYPLPGEQTVVVDPELQKEADRLKAKPHPVTAGVKPIDVNYNFKGPGGATTTVIRKIDQPVDRKELPRLQKDRVPSFEQGVQNILTVLRQATPEEVAYQRNWYRHAHAVAKTYAKKYDVDIEIAAAVIAVLSPGLAPGPNFDAAAKILGRHWNEVNAARTPGLMKAIEIMRTGDVSLVSKSLSSDVEASPKITAFFNSIYDPAATQKIAVLDGHAFNIWRGTPVNIAGAAIPEAWRDQIEAAYAKAGELSGYNLSAQEAQAVSWYVWRIMVQKEPMAQMGRKQVAVPRSTPGSNEPPRPGSSFQGAPHTDGRYTAQPAFMRRTWEAREPALFSVIDEARSLLPKVG